MTLNETEKRRLLQTLREDPDFLAEVRSLILPEELVQLPQRFAEFAAQVLAFIQRQEELNARFLDFMQRQEEFNRNQEEFNAEVRTFMQDQKEFNKSQEETNRSVNTRLRQITDDLGDLKGHVAGRIARETADDIAESLGFEIVQLLNGQDLRQMLRRERPSDLPSGTRRSFYNADVVARAIDTEGNERFLAIEASYTADRRDSDRAMRNAGLLTRFTGIPATAAIASLRNDYEVEELVERKAILWHQFETRDLTPG